ncbi:hypothetical protein GCM10010405_21690 [Streptomyces macrosporus]|uniref:Uncharacterized protein n=1 Tax=Streptomyces macrosporus TaxID=44032 RepID=A0ABP5WW14_9ACTN
MGVAVASAGRRSAEPPSTAPSAAAVTTQCTARARVWGSAGREGGGEDGAGVGWEGTYAEGVERGAEEGAEDGTEGDAEGDDAEPAGSCTRVDSCECGRPGVPSIVPHVTPRRNGRVPLSSPGPPTGAPDAPAPPGSGEPGGGGRASRGVGQPRPEPLPGPV